MKNGRMLLGMATVSVLALAAARAEAQSVLPVSDTYTWSGELVALDASGPTITVKAPVVGDRALAELPRFKSGDRIVLTWSGIDNYADAISHAVRYDAAKKWNNEPFTFPVDFVGYEPQQRYVTFKFKAPAGSVEPLKALKPGEWITATARHRPTNEADAITAVKPYTAAAGSSSN